MLKDGKIVCLPGVDMSCRLNAVECLVCYMLHQIAQSATHKFLFLPEAGRGVLVWCSVILLIPALGIFNRYHNYLFSFYFSSASGKGHV